MLESGAVSLKNQVNIMMKNVVDVVLGGITYWAFGYGLSYGKSEYSNAFVAFGDWFVDADGDEMGGVFTTFLFQLSFATTATTIVSGALAERLETVGCICRSRNYRREGRISMIVYCIPAHWLWSSIGVLHQLGVVDIAGSGGVHLVGGTSGTYIDARECQTNNKRMQTDIVFPALVGAIMLGPRLGRWDSEGSPPMGSPTNALIGLFMLWWGWLAFNSGRYGITDSTAIAILKLTQLQHVRGDGQQVAPGRQGHLHHHDGLLRRRAGRARHVLGHVQGEGGGHGNRQRRPGRPRRNHSWVRGGEHLGVVLHRLRGRGRRHRQRAHPAALPRGRRRRGHLRARVRGHVGPLGGRAVRHQGHPRQLLQVRRALPWWWMVSSRHPIVGGRHAQLVVRPEHLRPPLRTSTLLRSSDEVADTQSFSFLPQFVDLVIPLRMHAHEELLGADFFEHDIKHPGVGVSRAVSVLHYFHDDVDETLETTGTNTGE
ncbi:unnamed protein product [Sphagnum tenellum]